MLSYEWVEWCDGETEADVVDGELQEEGGEGLAGGWGHDGQPVHHLPRRALDLHVQGQTLLRPVLVCILVIQPHQHR